MIFKNLYVIMQKFFIKIFVNANILMEKNKVKVLFLEVLIEKVLLQHVFFMVLNYQVYQEHLKK